MVVKTIYVSRHGLRGTWNLNLQTGVYTSNILSPTNIPGDPPLVAYGVEQSYQLATALSSISPPVARIYSSPYYRCLETIRPTAEAMGLKISPDHGLGEWFGQAWFTHPVPALPDVLTSLFPAIETNYTPSCHPPASGESLPQLYARIAYALSYVITHADAESGNEEVAIAICTHAAPLIVIGRVLTGGLPANVEEHDFKTFTAGITRFERRTIADSDVEGRSLQKGEQVPVIDWTGGKGVLGGWNCVTNCDTAHLKGGGEREWFFAGDESFTDTKLSLVKTDGAEGGSRL